MTYSKEFTTWVVKTNIRRRNDTKIGWSRLINDKDSNRGFIMYDQKTGRVAYSFCHPDDDWCDDIGLAIAYARLRDIKIPPMEIYKVKDCIGKTVKYGDDTFYITPILALRGEIEAFYCLRFRANGSYPTGSQLCANTEVELVK